MNKKLTLLILFFPVVAFTQTQYKDGTISIDFGKKNKQQQDTVVKEKIVYPSDEEEAQEETPKQKREKKKASAPDTKDDFDFRKDGLFKGLFSAGLNACQVDGDNEYGYKYLGANVDVGVMIRFHRYMSVSLELGYTMKGAKARYSQAGANANFFRTNFDYAEVPIAFNVHDKKLVMFSVGLTPAMLVRYKEWDRVSGLEVTDNPPNGQPRKFDLSVFGGFYFVIKQQFVLGAKFSYSVLSLRPAESGTKVNGQYHNMLTFRFMYILSSIKKKK